MPEGFVPSGTWDKEENEKSLAWYSWRVAELGNPEIFALSIYRDGKGRKLDRTEYLRLEFTHVKDCSSTVRD